MNITSEDFKLLVTSDTIEEVIEVIAGIVEHHTPYKMIVCLEYIMEKYYKSSLLKKAFEHLIFESEHFAIDRETKIKYKSTLEECEDEIIRTFDVEYEGDEPFYEVGKDYKISWFYNHHPEYF